MPCFWAVHVANVVLFLSWALEYLGHSQRWNMPCWGYSFHKMRYVMILNSGNSLLLCCSQWWAVCVWYLGLSWSPGCSCWLWGQRPEWPPTTKLAFVHDHLLSPQATVKVSQHLPISYGLYSQVWSLTRLVRTHSRKHWCFGDLTDSTLADDDAKIKSFEDSSFKASLALAF